MNDRLARRRDRLVALAALQRLQASICLRRIDAHGARIAVVRPWRALARTALPLLAALPALRRAWAGGLALGLRAARRRR